MTVSSFDENKICNIALSRIGGGSIDSILAPLTDLEATCANLYTILVQSLLAHEWNFSDAEAELAKNPDATALKDYTSAFRLPGDLLSGPYAVYGDGSTRNDGAWRIVSDHLYCNYTTVIINYRRKPPVSEWPAPFTNLVIKALEADLAMPVRENASLKAALLQEAFGTPAENGRGGLFGIAKRLDAQSKPIRSMFRNGNPITSARFGGGVNASS